MQNGHFIIFIDADDFIEENMIEDLLTVALIEDSDIVQCGFKIIDEENELYEDSINEESAITPLNNIKNAINNMLQQAESSGKVFYMGSAKSQLQREFPDFDERNYGYSMFKTFIENELKLKVTINGSVAQIHRIKKDNRAEISKNVEALIIQRAKTGIGLGLLGLEINITVKGNKQSVHYTKNK